MTEPARIEDFNPLMSIKEVATYTGTTEKIVRTAIKGGNLQASRLTERTIRMRKSWVDEWIENNPVKTHQIDYGELRQVKPAGARRGRLNAVGGRS